MSKITLDSIAIDSPNPNETAKFYGGLMNIDVRGDWVNPFGDDSEIWFQGVEDYKAPTWPTQERGQQAHLEFVTNDVEAAARHAESLGATRAEFQPGADEPVGAWIVMLDPIGHPFCLVPPFDNIEPNLTESQKNQDVWIGFGAIDFDCGNGEELWQFYRLFGELTMVDVNGMAPALVADNGMMVLIQQVEGYQPPTWPTQERGQQLHIDFHTKDREAHVKRAIELGATFQEKEKTFTVLLDPAGHPFCICEDND